MPECTSGAMTWTEKAIRPLTHKAFSKADHGFHGRHDHSWNWLGIAVRLMGECPPWRTVLRGRDFITSGNKVPLLAEMEKQNRARSRNRDLL